MFVKIIHHTLICDGPRNSVEDDATRNNNEDDARYLKPIFHVGLAIDIAFITARAVIKGRNRFKVRVLFDSGSQRFFITSREVKLSGLEKIRNECIEISTFGQ